MPGYKPSFVYPFAVNSFISVTQVLTCIYGHKLTNRAKIQVPFAAATVLLLMIPFIVNYTSSAAKSFYLCMVVLLVLGVFNGVV